MSQITDVDNALAKIAAVGVSVLFASGDSGSGYAPPQPKCNPGEPGIMSDTVLEGTVREKVTVRQFEDCCFQGGMQGVAGWQWSPPGPPPNGTHYANCHSTQPGELSNTVFTGTIADKMIAQRAEICCEMAGNFPVPGVGWSFTPPAKGPGPQCVGPTPGELKNTQLVGTMKMRFGDLPIESCCEIYDEQGKELGLKGWTWQPLNKSTHAPPGAGSCTMFSAITGKKTAAGVNSHEGTPVPPVFGQCALFSKITGKKTVKNAQSHNGPPPPQGTCTLFSAVSGHKTSKGSTAGTPAKDQNVRLWPSWPAISPWLTSVGATRFLDASKTTGDEMATDQFGSGGGFSWNGPATKAQSADVANYLKIAPQLPPKGSFAPTGRATPDVAALGEGFQVVIGDRTEGVGGTSASTPTFAGIARRTFAEY